MKKILAAAMISILAISLSACGNGSNAGTSSDATLETKAKDNAGTSSEVSAETGVEDNTEAVSDGLALTLDEGTVRYIGFEKADPKLTDQKNALVFKFEYTNNQDKPAPYYQAFWITFFQNGVELSDSVSYYTIAGEQYELVHSAYNDVLKGGILTFGIIVNPKDDTPITVMINKQGDSDKYKMQEITISQTGQTTEDQSAKETVQAVSAEEIDEAVQGTWEVQGGNFIFEDGTLTIASGNQSLSGTYEIKLEESQIEGIMQASDAKVKVTIPFEYNNGEMKMWNNQGEEMTKR